MNLATIRYDLKGKVSLLHRPSGGLFAGQFGSLLPGHLTRFLIWEAWHIPYYLYFLDRGVLQEFTTVNNMALFIPLAILVAIAWAFVYGELYLLTKSVWPAVLMHTVEDALLFTLVLGRHIQIAPGTDWLISPMNGLISVVLFLAIGVGLRRYRRKNSQLSKESPQVVLA